MTMNICHPASMPATKRQQMQRRQQGVSLFIVMVVVLLVTLLVLWSARTSLFNQRVTGNDADYQRAFEAAQAMIKDAQLDIMGVQANGKPCREGSGQCRPNPSSLTQKPTASTIFFPRSETVFDPDGGDLVRLEAVMGSEKCVGAICMAKNMGEFWKSEEAMERLWSLGAFYGQYTGAVNTTGNPLLNASGQIRSRYWVEPLGFSASSKISHQFAPMGGGLSGNVGGIVFRITAASKGVRPGTFSVVQTIFVHKAPEEIIPPTP